MKQDLVVNPREHHNILAKCCFETMAHTLRRNVCQIPQDQASLFNRDVSDLSTRVGTHLPSHVQYAMRRWADHLRDSTIDSETLNSLKTFCYNHLMHWLEGLSLMGDIDVAVDILQVARRALAVRTRSPI